jgi:membrane-associated HD superfamily phosphohydrolase
VQLKRAFGRCIGMLKTVLSQIMKHRKIRRVSAAILFLLFVTFLLTSNILPNKSSLVVGQVSPRTYKAEKSIVFEDKEKTNEQRMQAADNAAKVYTRDPQVSNSVQQDITDLTGKVREIQGDNSLDPAGKAAKIHETLPFVLPVAEVEALAAASPETTKQVEDTLVAIVAAMLDAGEGVSQDGLEAAKNSLNNQIIQMYLAKHYEDFSLGVVDSYLRPNAFIDAEKTRENQQAAMDMVVPTMITVKEGEKIIGEGEIVTAEHLVKLQALGMTQPKLPWTSILGNFLLMILFVVLVVYYIYQQNRDIQPASEKYRIKP